ncbi:MAG TPA: hypothetical protein VLI92_01310 [Candidatus Saccharimonadales bacterium]|nr:hypothetical protein [Candidatus Saccharimonadales bacterium]
MKKIGVLIFVNILLVILQNSFFNELFSAKFNPNLVMAFGFAFLLMNDEEVGLSSLLIGGLVYDLLTFVTVGFSSFLFLILFELCVIATHYFSKSLPFKFLLLFISATIYTFFAVSNSFGSALVVAALTLLTSIIFYLLDANLLRYFSGTELGLMRQGYRS